MRPPSLVPALILAACAQPGLAAAQAGAPPGAGPGAHVSATIVPGTGGHPAALVLSPPRPRAGPVSLNLVAVEVNDFAKAVLGDVMGLSYAVDPAAKGAVSLVTPHPIARADVLPAVEDALKNANLALVQKAGVYTVLPLDAARAQAPIVGAAQPGFGTEVATLKFANPDEIRKLIDPVLPGVITATDPAGRTLTLSGASGQRRAARDLVRQFDVDWMRGMSFGLFVPKTTDARLIAPELEKLINAPGATTAGLVRLIPMERLNGIIAVATRPEYLEDVRRWVEVLDREGQSSERRIYVYRVQNGRAADLAQVLVAAFGGEASGPLGGAGKSATAGSGAGGASLHPASLTGAPAEPMGGLAAGQISPGQTLPGQTLPGQSPAPALASPHGGGGEGLVVTADEANNAVIAYATPREYAIIEDALGKLDLPPLQVVIEAAITEVTLNDTLRFGTQWYLQEHGNQFALTKGNTARPVQNFPGFAYTVFTNGQISATLDALSTVTHVTVLSAPNLLVLNNQTASLQVGDQVPIATGSAVSTVTTGAPLVNSIDYRDTGVILKITPRVNSGGLVLLDIAQEVSQVSPQTSSATNPIASPVIQERKIASSIAVKDGETIALGGLISDNVSKGRTGIPLLSAIPVLGALAGDRNNTRIRTELLVLLSPRVIRTAEQAQSVTDELRGKIRSVNPKPPRIEP
jgi:general secretion pathway protein D